MDNTLYIPIDTSIKKTVECQKLVKKGETLEFIIRIFTNGALADLTGESADIILIKSDGTRIERTIDKTNIANGTITVNLGRQPSLVAGYVTGEVQIYKDGSLDITNNFTYKVDESLADGIVEISEDDIEVLADLRNLIDKGKITIEKYEELVLAIGNSIEAIEALVNIKSYLELRLPALESANAQAVVNIESLKTGNNKADSNIVTLGELNDNAEKLKLILSTLTTENEKANNNYKILAPENTKATSNIDTLTNLNNNAKTKTDELNDSITDAETKKQEVIAECKVADNKIAAMQAFGDVTEVSKNITAMQTELKNARGTEVDLDARLDKFDTSLSDIALYGASCAYASNVYTLTLTNAPATLPNFFSIRFKATNAWVDGSNIKIGTKTYAVVNAAFAQDEVVTINIDEVAAKCFFKSGGGGGLTETLPQQVDTFTASGGNGVINLTWSNSNTNYLAGFYIVYKPDATPPNTPSDGSKIDITNPLATSAQIAAVTNGTQYQCRIYPYNSKKQVQAEYKVATATPQAGQPISNLPIGAKVLMKSTYQVESETPERLAVLIANKDQTNTGYPSNGVTLITEKIIDYRAFDGKEQYNSDSNRKLYGNNRYLYSNIRHFLNRGVGGYVSQYSYDAPPTNANCSPQTCGYENKNDFLSLFTTDELNALLPTTLKVVRNTIDGGGYDTITDKVFLPSKTEVGLTNENNIAEGIKLTLDNLHLSTITEQCFNNTLFTSKPAIGTTTNCALRTSAFADILTAATYCGTTSLYANGIRGIRPLFNIDNSKLVTPVANAQGYYELV